MPSLLQYWGRVEEIGAGQVRIGGISPQARVGNEIRIASPAHAGSTLGEVLSIERDHLTALLYGNEDEVAIGAKAYIDSSGSLEIGPHLFGNILNYEGRASGASAAKTTVTWRPLKSEPLPANERRLLGPRLKSGLMVFDTLLPICRGQRIGLFAGSGVGKSTLIGKLASGVQADRVIIALIGERSREVNSFAQKALSKEILAKSIIVAATASESAGAKKRAAFAALALAEHYRDQGEQVLLLFDSLTRFAEAHREIALSAGETPALNAFPPSTVRVISELVERSGCGSGHGGDITAIFSVLVSGSDMEEPLADMVRGILDGHIILSREIAERGRYPSVDVLRSVSRALPEAASDKENELLQEYRRLIATYDKILPMLQADLYKPGTDPTIDKAVRLYQKLDRFVSETNTGDVAEAFKQLSALLSESQ